MTTEHFPRRVSLAAIVLLVGVGIGLLAVTAEFLETRELILFEATVLAVVLAFPLLTRFVSGVFDLFEPIVIVALTYFLYFVFFPVQAVLSGNTAFLGREWAWAYPEALVLIIVGVVGVWAGYHLPLGAKIAEHLPAWEPSPAKMRRFGLILTVLAVSCFLGWSFATGAPLTRFLLPGLIVDEAAVTSSANTLNYLFLTLEWFIPAFLCLVASDGLRWPLLRYLYIAPIAVVYVSIGFRYRLLILLAGHFLTSSTVGTRRSSSGFRGIVVALLIVVMIGWVGLNRNVFRSGGYQGHVVTEVSSLWTTFVRSLAIFPPFAAVVQSVPSEIDYAYLEPWIYPAILPIPRQVWPDKPLPAYLSHVAESIGTLEAVTAGAAVPHFGEYYLSFGVIGIVVGSLLFGVGCRSLYIWRLIHSKNRWVVVIYSASLPFLVQVISRGYLAQMVQEWAFIILPALLGMYLTRERQVEGRP